MGHAWTILLGKSNVQVDSIAEVDQHNPDQILAIEGITS